MTLQGRHRLRLILAIILIFMVSMSMTVRLALAPMAAKLVQTQVDNQASDTINAAIADQISAGEFDYSRMVTIDKSTNGSVLAIRTNIVELNRLKTDVLMEIDSRLENLSIEEMGIPLGSIVLPELFSGNGPQIPVRVLAARASDASFRNDFTSAGINQTMHSIYIDIEVVVTVMMWTETYEIHVESSVIAAQTIIVGTVPTTYFGMEGTP